MLKVTRIKIKNIKVHHQISKYQKNSPIITMTVVVLKLYYYTCQNLQIIPNKIKNKETLIKQRNKNKS